MARRRRQWNEEWNCIIISCRYAEKREDLKVVFGKTGNGIQRVFSINGHVYMFRRWTGAGCRGRRNGKE
jgi:hypothetical protein